MTQPDPESNSILSYALQRRALITQACELVEKLGLPLGHDAGEPDGSLRSLAYVWAVSVHPDLMRWYRDAAHFTHAQSIHLLLDEGIEAVAPIEQLVQRDLKLFTMAIDAHLELPTEMQKRIIDMAPPMHVNSAILSPMRMATVLPGMLLLAWDQAWRDAIETFGDYVGDVVQTPAAMDAYNRRINDIEESVQQMLNRFIAISAIADIPETGIPASGSGNRSRTAWTHLET